MSYGCLVPELIATTAYLNTSCVATDGTPRDYAACQAKCAALGAKTVERIYLRKNVYNKWQAGYVTSTAALPVSYIDWGDNLESKSWPGRDRFRAGLSVEHPVRQHNLFHTRRALPLANERLLSHSGPRPPLSCLLP